MSSTVNMDMALISTSNMVPQEMLKEVFEDCVAELGGKIQDGCLFFDKENLGRINIGERIILAFSNDYETSKRDEARKLLRKTFTRKISIAHENYLSMLRKEKEKLENESLIEKELISSINKINEEINKSKMGFERQNLSECEAMKGEIIDAAISQGYEVVEEKTTEGIQLQFIRREY